jgi:subtilisin family serine protease
VDPTLFDSRTVWPKSGLLPPGFEPSRRLEEGKNPGLGLRSLHREGINGSGVGIAIIDQPLLRNHIEYADRTKSYHAMEVEGVTPQMHGPAVCSIAVGKSCGVAPQANVHYYAKHPGKWQENRPYVRTVQQILERNRDLPQSEKVRVISISLGMFWRWDHYDQWQAAVAKAKKNGILVVTCDQGFMDYGTIKRIVGKDPDDPNSYGPSRLYGDGAPLYVPDSYRTIASAEGKDVYTFDTWGGMSWAVPYLAGLAALAFQVHPEISPDRIVELWQETATPTKLGPVVNPRGFIEAVKRL